MSTYNNYQSLKMDKKHYIREGRRFVQVTAPSVSIPTVDGMYYNSDKTFSKEKKDNSVGFCIMQTNEKAIVISLQETSNITWEEAKLMERLENKTFPKMFYNGRLPKISELLAMYWKYRDILDIRWKDYWGTPDDVASATRAALAANYGYANYDPASYAYSVAGRGYKYRMRVVIEIPNEEFICE